jgi:predicted ATPase
LSLLSECSHWTATAIAALDKRSRNTEIEMELQAALGQALMFTSGNGDRVREAFDRSLSIAERIGNYRYQVYILGWLHIFHLRLGENYAAHADANRCEAAAALAGNPAMIAAANAFIGASCFVMGKHRECQQHLDATLASGLPETVSPPLYFGYDYLSHAAICRARNLWVLGYANQAVDAAVRTIDDASYQPVTLSVALLYAGSIQLWNGDLVSARKTVDAFVEHSELHSLAPYYAAGLGLQGQIDIRSGQIDEGVRSLRNALRLLEEDRYGLWIVVFTTALAEGLFAMNEIEEGLLNIEKAIRRADSNGDLFAMPEILRIKAELLVASSGIEAAAAEALLTESLELANSRSALAWELRSATSLGTLWMKRGRHEDALQLLSSVYDRFADGLFNSDLRAAAKMIEELRELLAPRPGSGPS